MNSTKLVGNLEIKQWDPLTREIIIEVIVEIIVEVAKHNSKVQAQKGFKDLE